MKKYLIVVAGGKGTRMGGEMPKQFQLLCGKPIVMTTLERLHAIDPTIQLILVLVVIHIKKMAKQQLDMLKEN